MIYKGQKSKRFRYSLQEWTLNLFCTKLSLQSYQPLNHSPFWHLLFGVLSGFTIDFCWFTILMLEMLRSSSTSFENEHSVHNTKLKSCHKSPRSCFINGLSHIFHLSELFLFRTGFQWLFFLESVSHRTCWLKSMQKLVVPHLYTIGLQKGRTNYDFLI